MKHEDRLYVFSDNRLDRVANQRRNSVWAAAQLESTKSRFLPFWNLQVPVCGDGDLSVVWNDFNILQYIDKETGPVLLGIENDIAHFAVDVTPLEDPESSLGLGEAKFSDVRSIASKVSSQEAGILAQGRAVIDWHARNKFCSKCGHATRQQDSGLMRVCTHCACENFPRTDPVVIMLVKYDDRILLGRQSTWPLGMYSCIAGFVDQGETIEAAARREVFEETGVIVGDVEYYASQPWPFPSSLMIGCVVSALTESINIDNHELESARWCEKDEVKRALEMPGDSSEFSLPQPLAIAHQLIRGWVFESSKG